MNRLLLLAVLATTFFGTWMWLPASDVPAEFPPEGQVLYVSPKGSDQADGSKEAALATVQRALELLSSPKGGTIVLAGGVYTESLTVEGEGGPLLITAAPGEKVTFEGGQKVSSWRPHPELKHVFLTEIPHRESPYGFFEYLDLWDQTERIRYGKMADAASVQHWPGSIAFLEGNTVAFRPHRGETPEALNLWANRSAKGISIRRSNVTLRGLHFQNYLGGSDARAVTITSQPGATIKECTFNNCAMGIAGNAENLTVSDSQFHEVGTGVLSSRNSKGVTIQRCVFESAIGRFALSYVRYGNGVRIYHDAEGALIEECVTSGFSAGVFIKTRSDKPDSLPFTFRYNTFLDGIRNGYGYHHSNTVISHNIIGTPTDSVGVGKKASYFAGKGARMSDNLFCGADAPETGQPFIDLPGGDLALRADLDRAVGATTLRKVTWSDRMARHLTPQADARKNKPVALVGQPVVTSSRQGAVVSAAFTQPVIASLHYRIKGTEEWRTAPGTDNTIRLPEDMKARIPFDPVEPDAYSWIFPLVDNRLAPQQTYEFRLSATHSEAGPLPDASGEFTTEGEPKRLHVTSNADPMLADGSERHPFGELQPALNRALPGDTILLSPGLYSRPALLLHGGSPTARITIEGAGWEKTILDGGKRVGTIIELKNAPHVTVQGVQLRWFGNFGITVDKSPGFHLEQCWIWNQEFSSTGNSGTALHLQHSPDSILSYNLFTRVQYSTIALESPRLTFTHNTAFGNLFSGLNLENSARNSTLTHNALTFTGNRPIYIREEDRAAFDSLVCDYNNYGSKLRKRAAKRPENDFKPAERYGLLSGESKAIAAITMGKDVWRDFHTMADWRAFSSKDQHSLFADPEYVNPAQGDLHLLPGSPNLLADGTFIGALSTGQRKSASP